jgi:hypothetical protein
MLDLPVRHEIPINLNILRQLPVRDSPLRLNLQLADRRLRPYERVNAIRHIGDCKRICLSSSDRCWCGD